MAKIVNLRAARKARDRRAAQALAAANRAKFGRSSADKAVTKAEVARIDWTVDGARIDSADPRPEDIT